MQNQPATEEKKPLVSIVIPAYNEQAIISKNLVVLCEYMRGLEEKYTWEILIVNDGSSDKTGELAEAFARENPNVTVIHHPVNLNLGNALKTGFAHAKGYYTITLDIDLSYSVDHISLILDTLNNTKADVVLASPYMKGGRITAVPFMRKILSKYVNHFMRFASQDKYYTFTCMVRGYKTEFLKSLNLKTITFEISPEILYKSMILRARIIEVPAHLDWTELNKMGKNRTSGMRFLAGILSGLMAGFIFRPYIFFLTFGLILFLLAFYIIVWIFINTFKIIPDIVINNPQFIDDRFSNAIGQVFNQSPHAFMVGGITLLAAIQVLSLGFISLQQKRYFEEMFHINTSILKKTSK